MISYLQGARQRFTEFGGFTVYDPAALPESISGWADCVLLRAEPGLITLVAPVPAGPEGALRRMSVDLSGLAEQLAAENRAEATVLFLVITPEPLTREQYQRWQELKLISKAVRLVPWVVDLTRSQLFEHSGPPFGIDPDLAVLAAPEDAQGSFEPQAEPARTPVRQGPEKPAWRLAPVTVGLIAAMVLLWVMMTAAGRSLQATEDIDLLTRWGAQARPDVWQFHQYWRLFTANFLHIGFVHLAMNMLSLWVVGRIVEAIYGPWRMLYIYLVAGVMGAAASAVFGPPIAISAGASGAIFGLVGAMLWFRFSSPLGDRIPLRSLLIALGLNLAVDLALWKFVDNYNHLGGLIGGTVASLAAGVPMVAGLPRPRVHWGKWPHVALSALLLAGSVALSVGLVDLPGPGRDLSRAMDAVDAGRWAEAEAGFRRAIDRQADEPLPHLGLAWALYNQGQCAPAKQELARTEQLADDLSSVSDWVARIRQCKP